MSNGPTSRKIDFYGGTHGNFLELVVNHAIDQNDYDISQPQFVDNGACHAKISSSYVPITVCHHYSMYKIPFKDTDYVVRIVPKQSDMLIAVINSFLRAGDQTLDIENLEVDTRRKMMELPKLSDFLKTLTNNHGLADSYSRKILRHYFEAMFNDPDNGLNVFTDWVPAQKVHHFDFFTFFHIEHFFESLQKIAQFYNLEFRPSESLIRLHEEFLERNQGWHSHLKCSKILECIVKKQTVDIKLNVIEEAWISYRISKIFNLYELPCLQQDQFPSTTEEIIKDIDKGFVC